MEFRFKVAAELEAMEQWLQVRIPLKAHRLIWSLLILNIALHQTEPTTPGPRLIRTRTAASIHAEHQSGRKALQAKDKPANVKGDDEDFSNDDTSEGSDDDIRCCPYAFKVPKGTPR